MYEWGCTHSYLSTKAKDSDLKRVRLRKEYREPPLNLLYYLCFTYRIWTTIFSSSKKTRRDHHYSTFGLFLYLYNLLIIMTIDTLINHTKMDTKDTLFIILCWNMLISETLISFKSTVKGTLEKVTPCDVYIIILRMDDLVLIQWNDFLLREKRPDVKTFLFYISHHIFHL